jgi:hypothetical protein
MSIKYGIFVYNPDTEEMELAVEVKLKSGVITAKALPGHENMAADVMEHTCIIDEGKTGVTATSDPQKWIQALPDNYGGTYVRTELLK